MPKVSVIIPTYNRANYLPEAINSVLKQTYQDFETIIVDDDSTDNTKEVVNAYIEKNPQKIAYIYQKNNGPAAARNRGIKEAKGEYIAFLDSDDLWLPDKLKKSMDFINKHGFDWICTSSYIIREEGGNKQEKNKICIDSIFLDSSGRKVELVKNGLFFFSSLHIYTPAVLIRDYCFKKVGFFDETFKIGEDVDFWLRLEEAKLSGGYLNEPLCVYRINNSSITKSRDISGLKENLRLAKKHAKLLGMGRPIIRESYSDFLWRCSDLFFNSGRYRDSFKCFLKSWYLYPEVEKINKMLRFISRRIGKIR